MNELQSIHPQSAATEAGISKLLRFIINIVAVAAVVLAALASTPHSGTKGAASTIAEPAQ